MEANIHTLNDKPQIKNFRGGTKSQGSKGSFTNTQF